MQHACFTNLPLNCTKSETFYLEIALDFNRWRHYVRPERMSDWLRKKTLIHNQVVLIKEKLIFVVIDSKEYVVGQFGVVNLFNILYCLFILFLFLSLTLFWIESQNDLFKDKWSGYGYKIVAHNLIEVVEVAHLTVAHLGVGIF